MWFIDFAMAHRALGIESMWSIERPEGAARAEFNKPYSCIEVKPGSVSSVLKAMQADDWAKPTVAWLDYDGRFDDEVRDDCERYLKCAQVGSVIALTVNAHRNSYRPGQGLEKVHSIKTLRDLIGDAVPADAAARNADVSFDDFSGVLSKSILNFMSGATRRSGRETEGLPDRFVPLFQLHHEDNAPMITVGGIVASSRQLPLLAPIFVTDATRLMAGQAAVKDSLELIPITMKEKLALDRLLPCSPETLAQQIVEMGIKLELEEAEKYRRSYTHFPVFAQTMI